MAHIKYDNKLINKRERGGGVIPLDVQQQVDSHILFHSNGGHHSILKSTNKRGSEIIYRKYKNHVVP